MTKEAKKRALEVKRHGIVGMKKSGEVYVNWDKAVRSSMMKDLIDSIDALQFESAENK